MSAALLLTLASCTPSTTSEPAADPAPTPPAADPPTPASDTAPTPDLPMPGGYAPASLEDETVKAAQALAVDAIYTRNPTRALVETVEAQQQVVAGMNYRFTITMSGGARYGVTVFRDLEGKMEVTDYAKLS